MLQHPLRLKRTAVFEFRIETEAEFQKKDSGFNVTTTQQLQNSRDLKTWVFFLRIQLLDHAEGKKAPYHADVTLAAEYTWQGEEAAWNKLAKLVGVSASQMLYGQARELILLVSGRGMHGPFSLPTVSFQDYDPGEQPIEIARDPNTSGSEQNDADGDVPLPQPIRRPVDPKDQPRSGAGTSATTRKSSRKRSKRR